jgi:ATP phosphoribosyltransferase regulatory subunit HisZ
MIEAIGKKDLLADIKKNVKSERTLLSLQRLEKLYELLEKNGLEKNVSFDFSILSFGDYYTGIAIQGYTKGIGTPILDGGRYDNLINGFGVKRSACGFAINVNDLIDKTILTCERSTKMVYSKDIEKAICKRGNDAFVSLEETLEGAFRYGIANDVKEIIDIDSNKKYVLSGGEYVWEE